MSTLILCIIMGVLERWGRFLLVAEVRTGKLSKNWPV